MPLLTFGSVVDVDGLLAAADRTLPLPVTSARLAALADLPGASRANTIEAIRFDPVLTAMTLRRAGNAVSSGVSTVEEAASVLGDGLGGLISGVGAVSAGDPPPCGYDALAVWRRSVLATLAAETIVERAGGRVPPDAVPAAAMHQLGNVVLYGHLGPDISRRIAAVARADGYSELEAELETLQVSHGEVAAFVLEAWGLAEPIVTGVRYCQVPDIGGDPVSCAVALATMVAAEVVAGATMRTSAGRGIHSESPIEPALLEEADAKLGLGPAIHDEVLHLTAARFGRVTVRFGLA